MRNKLFAVAVLGFFLGVAFGHFFWPKIEIEEKIVKKYVPYLDFTKDQEENIRKIKVYLSTYNQEIIDKDEFERQRLELKKQQQQFKDEFKELKWDIEKKQWALEKQRLDIYKEGFKEGIKFADDQ